MLKLPRSYYYGRKAALSIEVAVTRDTAHRLTLQSHRDQNFDCRFIEEQVYNTLRVIHAEFIRPFCVDDQ